MRAVDLSVLCSVLACVGLVLLPACQAPVPAETATEQTAALSAASQDAVQAAVAASEDTALPPVAVLPPAALRQGIDLGPLLSIEDLRALLPNAELFEAELQGIPPSENYGSIRFQERAGERYGLGLQRWRCDGASCEERLALHEHTYAGARRVGGVGATTEPEPSNTAIEAKIGRIAHLSWIASDRRSVLTLTCDDRICDPGALRALGHKVEERLRSSSTGESHE